MIGSIGTMPSLKEAVEAASLVERYLRVYGKSNPDMITNAYLIWDALDRVESSNGLSILQREMREVMKYVRKEHNDDIAND